MSENKITEIEETEMSAPTDALYAAEFFDIGRHNLITGTAVRLLSENASAKVNEILQPIGQTFDDQGGWADEIKKSAANRPQDDATNEFFADNRNRSHKKWHYVDIPLNTQSYAEAADFGFTRRNDVVQMAKECVLVLKGESDRFSEINALRLLSHLVGDIHQPLHIVCEFIDDHRELDKLERDPKVVRDKNLDSDIGGNSIKLPKSGSMHTYWDHGLGGLIDSIDVDEFESDEVEDDDNSVENAELKNKLIVKLYQLAGEIEESASFESDSIPVENWVEQWANESLEAAREAYRTLEIIETVKKTNANGSVEISYKVSWEGRDKYNERCAPILRNRMAMAAKHLAELLNAIYESN